MAMEGATKVAKSGIRLAIGAFFEYDTPKIVHIRSKKVGVINRIIQLGIIAYIIGYAIVYKKGYQSFEDAESAITTKVKGVVYTNLSAMFNITVENPNQQILDGRIWDVADYVVPPQERGAFFVTTNLVVTPNQTLSECDEDPNMQDVHCDIHNPTNWTNECPPNTPVPNGNGVRTGVCVKSTQNTSMSVCQIHAWCPVEVDELPVPGKAILKDSKDFTVLIKNSIEFPNFKVKRRNILERARNKDYLQKCRFNASHETDKFCPIFELKTIVANAGENYDELAVKGGVIAINIDWDCNLDFDAYYCTPEYSFRRIDDKNTNISAGWNFRYANYYNEDGVDKRTLIKAYGIRFLVIVTGKAGKFNIVPLVLNIGSGLALLGIATVLCDIVVMYLLKRGSFYQSKKYLQVVDDDAFKGEILNDSQQANYGATGQSSRENSVNQGSADVTNRRRGRAGYDRLEET